MMTHDQLLHDKADLIYELGEARLRWRQENIGVISQVGKVVIGGTAELDCLLLEYHDNEIALCHEEITDYD